MNYPYIFLNPISLDVSSHCRFNHKMGSTHQLKPTFVLVVVAFMFWEQWYIILVVQVQCHLKCFSRGNLCSFLSLLFVSCPMPSYHQYWCTLIIFIYPFLLLWEQLSDGNFWTWKYMTCWCRNPTIWYGWGIVTLGPYPTYPTYHMGMKWMIRWYVGVSYLSSILRRNYTLCFKLVLNLEDSQTSLENWWQKIYSTDQKSFCHGMVKRKGPYRCKEGICALCLFPW